MYVNDLANVLVSTILFPILFVVDTNVFVKCFDGYYEQRARKIYPGY